MDNKIKPEEIDLGFIREVKTLVEKEFEDGIKTVECYFETNSIGSRLNFDQFLDGKKPHPVNLSIKKIGLHKEVILRHKIDDRRGHVLVGRSTQRELFYAIDYYQKGKRLVSRTEKYMNMYMAYESLVLKPEFEFKAIRHVLSHPKLKDPKVIAFLKKVFGDDKIDLNKEFHNIILKGNHAKLYFQVRTLLVERLCASAIKSKKRVGQFIFI